jgi:hypothetical protein
MALAVVLAMKCDATMTPDGAGPALSSSPQQTFARPISHRPMTMEDGAILHSNILIWQSLLSCKLQNTALE